MLTVTHIEGERVAAVFPCIGGTAEKAWIADYVVVTIEDDGGEGAFATWRVQPGGDFVKTGDFDTFPRALITARKSQGWG